MSADTGPPNAEGRPSDRTANQQGNTANTDSRSFLDRACERGLLILLSVAKDDNKCYRLGMEARAGNDAGMTMFWLAERAVDYLVNKYGGDRKRVIADLEAEVFSQIVGPQ